MTDATGKARALADRADVLAGELDAFAEEVEGVDALGKLHRQARFMADTSDTFAGRMDRAAARLEEEAGAGR